MTTGIYEQILEFYSNKNVN